MFSAALGCFRTSCIAQRCPVFRPYLAPHATTPFSPIYRFSCVCAVPERLQYFTLARRKREGDKARIYWHSIRKRFRSTDASIKSSSSAKKTKADKRNSSGMEDGRCWEVTSCDNPQIGEGVEMTVMSYNILAQHLLNIHPSLYDRHVRQHLDWDHRLALIVRHIESIQPAVLCLQEVQACHLAELSKRLARMGLDQHIYKKRTNEEYKDGCAIFYKSNCLYLVDFHRVEFFQPKVTVRLRDKM